MKQAARKESNKQSTSAESTSSPRQELAAADESKEKEASNQQPTSAEGTSGPLCFISQETLRKYRRRLAEGYDLPDGAYQQWKAHQSNG